MGIAIRKSIYLFFCLATFSVHMLVFTRNSAPMAAYRHVASLKTDSASQASSKLRLLRFLKRYTKLTRPLSQSKNRFITQAQSLYKRARSKVQDNYVQYLAIGSGMLVGASFLKDIFFRMCNGTQAPAAVIAEPKVERSVSDLMSAINRCDVGQMRILIDNGASLDEDEGGQPTLIAALRTNNREMIEALIQGKADVNRSSIFDAFAPREAYNAGISCSRDVGTPLYAALMWRCSTETIRLLLDEGAIVQDQKYFTLAFNRPDVVEMLIDKMDPGERDVSITNLLVCAASYNSDNKQLIITLLSKNPDFRLIHAQKRDFLHQIIERYKGSTSELTALLVKIGAPLDQENGEGETVMGYQVRTGNISAVCQLLDLSNSEDPIYAVGALREFISSTDIVRIVQRYLLYFCDANETDSRGRTLLGIAIRAQRGSMVRHLLERGADPNTLSAGVFPLYLCIQVDDNKNAIRRRILKTLLSQKADPNAELDFETGDTILHRLSHKNLGWDASSLFKHSSDLEVRNRRGRTPLLQAVEEGDSELVFIMSGYHECNPKKLAKPIDVHATIRETGDTALHIIASKYKALDSGGVNEKDERKQKAKTIARELIDAKASIHAKNLEGKTPLELAAGTTLRELMQKRMQNKMQEMQEGEGVFGL